MKFHEAATLFRMMNDDEYAVIRDSIRDRGVINPIVVLGDEIIDGRNRWKACQELGVKCPTVQWNPKKHGDSVVQYAIAANLPRRELSKGERAMIAVKSLPLIEAEAAAKQKTGKADLGANLRQGRAPKSTEIAAKSAGVSARTVESAKKLDKEAPEIAAEVATGAITLNAGVKKSKAPPKPEPKKDGNGRDVTNQALKEALAVAPKLSAIGRLIDEARRGIEALVGQPISAHLHHSKIIIDLENAKSAILWGMPFAECPYMPNCKRGCKVCGGVQWVNKDKWKAVPKDIREAKTK